MTDIKRTELLEHIADQKRRFQTVSLSFEQCDALLALAPPLPDREEIAAAEVYRIANIIGDQMEATLEVDRVTGDINGLIHARYAAARTILALREPGEGVAQQPVVFGAWHDISLASEDIRSLAKSRESDGNRALVDFGGSTIGGFPFVLQFNVPGTKVERWALLPKWWEDSTPPRAGAEAAEPKAVAEAFSDWMWKKDGDAIGVMPAVNAARTAFAAGVKWCTERTTSPPAQAAGNGSALERSEQYTFEIAARLLRERDEWKAKAEAALTPTNRDALVEALRPFAEIGLDVLKNHPGWANAVFQSEWAGYLLTYAQFEQAAIALSQEAPDAGNDRILPDDLDQRDAWLREKAADLGYVLVNEPEHPDSPHHLWRDARAGEIRPGDPDRMKLFTATIHVSDHSNAVECHHRIREAAIARRDFVLKAIRSQEPRSAVADEVIDEIEKRFPNWKSFRNLVDCIDCTLHELRSVRP